MKPIQVFEMDLWHAKRYVKCALQDILDRKDEMNFDDAQQLAWQINNALKWLESVETYYKVSVTKEDKQ